MIFSTHSKTKEKIFKYLNFDLVLLVGSWKLLVVGSAEVEVGYHGHGAGFSAIAFIHSFIGVLKMTSFLAGRLTFIVLAAALGLFVFDIKEHGSFDASKTGRFLRDSGAQHYGQIAWTNFRSYSQQGYRWCQKNVPVYITKVRESAAPYLQTALQCVTSLAQQLWANVKLLAGYISEKKPVVEQWINQYAPGIIEIVSSWLRQAWAFLRHYTVLVVDLLLKYFWAAAQWLKENVFVGSLSPENLQRFTMDALNTTQQLASQTFSWLNDKVVTVISAS